MTDPFNPALWREFYGLILSWIQTEVLTLDSLVQGLALLVIALLARFIAKPLQPRLKARLEGLKVYSTLRRALSVIDDQLLSLVLCCCFGWPSAWWSKLRRA